MKVLFLIIAVVSLSSCNFNRQSNSYQLAEDQNLEILSVSGIITGADKLTPEKRNVYFSSLLDKTLNGEMEIQDTLEILEPIKKINGIPTITFLDPTLAKKVTENKTKQVHSITVSLRFLQNISDAEVDAWFRDLSAFRKGDKFTFSAEPDFTMDEEFRVVVASGEHQDKYDIQMRLLSFEDK